MDSKTLSELLQQPESRTLDFKATSYDLANRRQKRNFAKDIASLANTPREVDAYLILGVKKFPDGTHDLWGIDGKIDDADLQNVAYSLLEPALQFSYQPIRHCGVLLGVITIPIPSAHRMPVTPRMTLDYGFVQSSIYFRRGSQNAAASTIEQKGIWDWLHGQINSATFEDFLNERDASQRRLVVDALLHGPVEALGLASKTEEAEILAGGSPKDVVGLYEEIAEAVRRRFPGQADQFDQLRAKALRDAGSTKTSHDLLIKLAMREIYELAKPQLSRALAHELTELHSEVDLVRQARAGALIHFGRCHEYAGELERLAEWFDVLGPTDEYSPVIATLLVEAAVADRRFQVVLDRSDVLLKVKTDDTASSGPRLRAALADAGIQGIWDDLIREAKALHFPPAEGAFVCLRGARWCSWNGQLEEAESLYRLAMTLGAEADLDLDVENALWALTALYSLRRSLEDMSRTNRAALSIEGTRSFVTANTRTREHTYRYLANGELPNAHLWTQYRLLESIRSGCLMDELETHEILSRIYDQSGESTDALEHAILGGGEKRVKDLARRVDEWPEYMVDMLRSDAIWVRKTACQALEYIGDLAPPSIARKLFAELTGWFHKDLDFTEMAPLVLKALGAVVLDATDDDIEQLMPVLEQLAVRAPATYKLTDPGVLTLAARLYRFRPAFKKRASSILAEMSIGSHTGDWSRALNECGDNTGELVEAFQRVGEREGVDQAGPLSDLGHVAVPTQTIWTQRLQYVDDYTLGERSGHPIGADFGVPADFLKKQEPKTLWNYVDKLVAIGCDDGELAINRASALAAAASASEVLQTVQKKHVFERVRSLVEQPIPISEMDRFHASTQHPLSRFQISFGDATDVQKSVGWLLGKSATSLDQCAAATEFALSWVRSGDVALQQTGASILCLPNLTSDPSTILELSRHTNPSVRRTAAWLSQGSQELAVLEQLVSDPDRRVRIAVVEALSAVGPMDPDAYEQIRAYLNADQSAIVRACASTLEKD